MRKPSFKITPLQFHIIAEFGKRFIQLEFLVCTIGAEPRFFIKPAGAPVCFQHPEDGSLISLFVEITKAKAHPILCKASTPGFRQGIKRANLSDIFGIFAFPRGAKYGNPFWCSCMMEQKRSFFADTIIPPENFRSFFRGKPIQVGCWKTAVVRCFPGNCMDLTESFRHFKRRRQRVKRFVQSGRLLKKNVIAYLIS